jgi:hypothetical protein
VQWTGDNLAEVQQFCPSAHLIEVEDIDDVKHKVLHISAGVMGSQGSVPVPVGHYVVRKPGDDSDYWPVDEAYFNEKYEAVWPVGESAWEGHNETALSHGILWGTLMSLDNVKVTPEPDEEGYTNYLDIEIDVLGGPKVVMRVKVIEGVVVSVIEDGEEE